MPKKKKDPEMLGVKKKDMRKYKEWVRMARQKRKEQLVPRAKKIKSMWRSKGRPDWSDDDQDMVNVNLVYANIEITKTNVFYRNPKAYITPKQEVFIMENGQQLDGRRGAQHLEDAANYVAYEIKLNRTIKKVRDDTLTKIYGVIFVGYEGLVGIDEEENEFIREDSIYAVRLDPCSEFLCDPEALDSFAFSDARWVAREYSIRLSDFLDNDSYENTDEVKSSAKNRGYGDKVKDDDNAGKTLLDYASSEFRDSKDARRITLIEMWLRPTQAERAKGKKGKLIVFSMENDKPHKARKWPFEMKGYPFRGLGFNRDNDDFYPFHDVEIYEQQLIEKDKMRTAQLEAVKTLGQRKIAISPDYFDSEEDIDKLTDPESGPFIKVQTDDIRKAVMAISFGSYPNELFTVDKKIDDDIDKVSGIGDLRRGMPPPGLDTATEGKLLWAGGGTRFEEKRQEMAEFYEAVMRMIIQLIKQTWTPEKMVRRLGTLTPEWPDEFSKEDIQIEDDITVDIGEMIPPDDVVRKRFAMEILELAVKGATDPAVKQELAREGYRVSISEAVKGALSALNVKNQKLLQRISPQDYVKVLQDLLREETKGGQPGGMPGNGSRGAGVSGRKGIPSYASELSGAKRRGGSQSSGIFPGVK